MLLFALAGTTLVETDAGSVRSVPPEHTLVLTAAGPDGAALRLRAAEGTAAALFVTLTRRPTSD